MMERPVTFDRLAGIYRWLELLAFGHDLERARFCFLDRLATCRDILVLGEGDGRCLARLVQIAPHARIHCVDSSPAMLAAAKRRLSNEARERVTFECADVLSLSFPPGRYDAVTTLFFLDCFSDSQAQALIARIRASLQPGAVWLFVDFVEPAPGWRRVRARVWLALLYAFFRWGTGLTARALPASERLLAAAGFRQRASHEYQAGLLRSAIFAGPLIAASAASSERAR